MSNLCQEIILPGSSATNFLTKKYVPGFMIDSHYPFTIRNFSIEEGCESENIKQTNILAQYIQSERFVKYGKSDKRVQKHITKMRYIIDNFPDELL